MKEKEDEDKEDEEEEKSGNEEANSEQNKGSPSDQITLRDLLK